MKKILGSAVGGGFKAWLVKLIAKELYDELGEPILHFAFNEAGYAYNKINGKITVHKLAEAREEGNADNYDAATDDVFS